MKRLLSLLLILFILTPALSQERKKRRLNKQIRIEQTYENFKSLVDQQAFTFVAKWMMSNNGDQTMVGTRMAYLEFADGKVKGIFPYFGTVRGSGAHSGGGIELDGEVYDYAQEIEPGEQQVRLTFRTIFKSERYEIFMNRSKQYVEVYIRSNKRDGMGFLGKVVPVN